MGGSEGPTIPSCCHHAPLSAPVGQRREHSSSEHLSKKPLNRSFSSSDNAGKAGITIPIGQVRKPKLRRTVLPQVTCSGAQPGSPLEARVWPPSDSPLGQEARVLVGFPAARGSQVLWASSAKAPARLVQTPFSLCFSHPRWPGNSPALLPAAQKVSGE